MEKDAALERRFQPVIVDEPSADETLDILSGLKERYERHHRCIYDVGALEAAVALSSRYVADRHLPDKVCDPGCLLLAQSSSHIYLIMIASQVRPGSRSGGLVRRQLT